MIEIHSCIHQIVTMCVCRLYSIGYRILIFDISCENYLKQKNRRVENCFTIQWKNLSSHIYCGYLTHMNGRYLVHESLSTITCLWYGTVRFRLINYMNIQLVYIYISQCSYLYRFTCILYLMFFFHMDIHLLWMYAYYL